MSKQITIYSRRTKTNLIMDIVNIMIVKPNDKKIPYEELSLIHFSWISHGGMF